ncbi:MULTISPECIES: hypothetical protein [unclassified Moorena]|nr:MULTISPECIES: hypothetical protein [unclassified Moorena]
MRYTGFFPSSLFSVPCSLFPKTQESVPYPIENRYITQFGAFF